MNIRIPETFNFDPAMLKRIAELQKSEPKKKTASKRKTTPRKAVARKVPVRTRSVRKRTPVRKPSPPKAPKTTIEPLVIDVVENAMGAPSVPAPTRKKIPKKKTVARKTVAKKKPVKPKLPEGVRSGGRTYTNPVSGDKMYQPPMPKLPDGMMGAQVMPTPINLTTGKPERVFLSEPTAPQPPASQQQTGGSFESAYIDWMESKPTQPRRPKGMGAASKKYQKANRDYKENLKQWEASKPSRASFVPSSPPPTAPTAPVVQPDYAPPPREELPDRFAGRYVPQGSILGTPDMSISSNIVGQSYDPNFAASFRPPPQPPGSTFGGYGQQAPMAALAPYAGMAQSQPMPTDFFPTYIPRPDPIIETVQRPEPNRPAPRPNQYPVMSSDIPGAIPGQTPGVDFDVFEQPF